MKAQGNWLEWLNSMAKKSCDGERRKSVCRAELEAFRGAGGVHGSASLKERDNWLEWLNSMVKKS